MEFPRQEYWSGLPLPSPGDLPDPGIKHTSPALAGGFLTPESPGNSPPPTYLHNLWDRGSHTLALPMDIFPGLLFPGLFLLLLLGLSSVAPEHHRKLPDSIEMLALKFLERPTSLVFPQA